MANKAKIVVDLDRMKYPNTGMFHFCYNLYLQFVQNDSFNFWFYKHKKTVLNTSKTIDIKTIDNYYLAPKNDVEIWHTTSQLSKRIPEKGCKMVYTLHDLNFLYTNKPSWKKARELKKIQARIDRADYLTFISNFTKNEIQKHFNIVHKPSKVIYNGVQINEFKDFNNPRIQPKNSFLFTIGVIAAKKNIHTIICLLANNTFDLVIAGIKAEEDYYNELITQIKAEGFSERVHFTFAISEEEKYWYYANCEAFLFPSISEGFGLPVIEAMRFGKPVFLSKYTSLPEIGGKEAYYFDSFEPKIMQENFKNGLENYQNNPEKKAAIINWSLQFTWEKAAKEYIEIYKEILNY